MLEDPGHSVARPDDLGLQARAPPGAPANRGEQRPRLVLIALQALIQLARRRRAVVGCGERADAGSAARPPVIDAVVIPNLGTFQGQANVHIAVQPPLLVEQAFCGAYLASRCEVLRQVQRQVLSGAADATAAGMSQHRAILLSLLTTGIGDHGVGVTRLGGVLKGAHSLFIIQHHLGRSCGAVRVRVGIALQSQNFIRNLGFIGVRDLGAEVCLRLPSGASAQPIIVGDAPAVPTFGVLFCCHRPNE
mmetsp:Transcript_28377/g.47962  ORF Transcript_28377/g.47962 Transcript_28377/m.47962 type:complete len:248 (+) Transcript_28377:495-1238(+)